MKSDFPVFVTVLRVHSFRADGSFLMPTHRHLLDRNKLSVLGGAGRDKNRGKREALGA